MTATNPPTDPAEHVRWLVDRAAIRDLVDDFAVCIDTKDKAGYAANFTEDAVLELPHGRTEGRAAIAAMPGPRPEWATQHLVGSVVIRLDPADPDRADVRAYVQVAHVLHGGPGGLPALAGGWYDNIAVRTAEGWRFSRVRLEIAWNGERPMLPEGIGAGR